MIVKTLEEQPSNATHWSTRSMAAATGMSQTAVSRIWRAFALKPHQIETFKLSPDPQFIDKVRDIVGLYLNPPEAAVVLCVDEKSQIQALDRSAPVLPLMPGVPARQTHDYVRNGTTNLYAALDVASGQVIAEMTPRHRAEEFRRFLNLIDTSVPAHLDVHVVLDNSSTHKTPSIQRWLVRHPRFTLHFTPTYSSWLNLVERWFAELTTKWIKRGSPPLRPRPRRLDPHLDHQLERRPQALRLAQERRRDPRQPRRLLPADQRLRSLAEGGDPLDEQVEEPVGVDVDADVGVRRPAVVRPRQSTTVRPRQSSSESTSMSRCRASYEAGRDHVRDGDGVVDRRAVPAVRLTVVDGEEVDEVGHEHADRPGGAQPLLDRRGREREVRDVEADHRHVDARVKTRLRCLGVGPDVELGGRRHVALGDRRRPSGRSARRWRLRCARAAARCSSAGRSARA